MQEITLEWMRERSSMTKKKAIKLIEELEDAIHELEERRRSVNSRIMKNNLYAQIANRKDQIAWANQFLK